MWGNSLLGEGVVSSLATDFIHVIHCYIEQVLPCQCMHLLVRQFPVFAGTAAACPLLSGHNVPHTAPAFDSENSNSVINFLELFGHCYLIFELCVAKVTDSKYSVNKKGKIKFTTVLFCLFWTMNFNTGDPQTTARDVFPLNIPYFNYSKHLNLGENL